MKTMRYTTREGKVWTVTECAPLVMHPGFWLGFRQPDGQQVLIHEHRAVEVLGQGAGDRNQAADGKGNAA